jgi:predicted amidophosphoribosyltransferase
MDRPHFHTLRAWAVFGDPVQGALHKLKYRRDISLGEAIASQMVSFVQELKWPINMIVPVPLGKHRLKERGYNQVGMIAKPLAMALKIQYAPQELMRYKETRSQVGLTKSERKSNVKSAFWLVWGLETKLCS